MPMLKNISKVSNPLTVIAIFASVAEIMATVGISQVSQDNQAVFLWFVMLFPVLLVVLFFITLNFNPKVIYAPSDFSNEDNFLKALSIGAQDFKPEHVDIINKGAFFKDKVDFEFKPWTHATTEIAHPAVRKYIAKTNSFHKRLSSMIKEKLGNEVFEIFRYSIEAPEYFTISYIFNKEKFGDNNETRIPRTIIIKITGYPENIKLIAIGKNIVTSNEKEFAKKVFEFINTEKESVVFHSRNTAEH